MEEDPGKSQTQDEQHEPQVAEIKLGATAVEVTASTVPITNRGPYDSDRITTFGGLGIDAYVHFDN